MVNDNHHSYSLKFMLQICIIALFHLTNFNCFSWHSQWLLLQSLIWKFLRTHQSLLTILVAEKKLKNNSEYFVWKYSPLGIHRKRQKLLGLDSCFYPRQCQPVETWTKYPRITVRPSSGQLPELAGSISNSTNRPDLISSQTELSAHHLHWPGQPASLCFLHCPHGPIRLHKRDATPAWAKPFLAKAEEKKLLR